METQMKGMVMGPKGPKGINLFAYSTNGLPGLEIHLGNLSTKNLREKFIFLTKVRRLSIPIKRYVICAELEGMKIDEEQISYLELPLLILYWHLAGLIPLMNLSSCFTQGSISSLGQIHHASFPEAIYLNLKKEFEKIGQRNFTLILEGDASLFHRIQCLPTLEILSSIEGLTLTQKSVMIPQNSIEAPQIGFS